MIIACDCVAPIFDPAPLADQFELLLGTPGAKGLLIYEERDASVMRRFEALCAERNIALSHVDRAQLDATSAPQDISIMWLTLQH